MRDSTDELFHLANLPAFTDELARRVELLFKPLVLGTQCIQGKDVFQRYRCDSGDPAEEMNVIFAKLRSIVGRSEVDDTERFLHAYERQAEDIPGIARV